MVKKKSGTKRWLKISIWVVLLLLLIAGSVYIFRYSVIFRVKDIQVNEINVTNGTSITAAEILNGRKYTSMLAPFPSIDTTQFPYIATFTVTKNYFTRTVVIDAVARERQFIWCMTASSSGGCYWADNTGFIFDTAPLPSGGDIRVVHDSSGRNLGIGDYALSPDLFKNFTADLGILDQLNIPIVSIDITDINHEEMTVVTSGGPMIYFGFTFDPVASGDDAVLRQLFQSPDWNKYCYVDLRIIYKAYTSKTCS